MPKNPTIKEYNKIKRNIVKRLYSKCFNKGHLLYERLQSGLPRHLAGFVKEILNDLIKEELVLKYAKTKHGAAYQLNSKKLEQIEELVN